MPYIGNPIYQSAFVTDQFTGNGSTTAFTMSVAPAGTSNVLVAVSGVLQDPSTYGVSGNTLTFTTAPPPGTGNISCRYLGIPVTGVTTTAYRTVTEFTATAGQTTFTPPSYTVGYIDVFLNGVLLGSADYTASNGTTVVLTTGASAGNILTTESFYVSSVLNAIPNTAGSVSSSNIQTSPTLTTPTIDKINTSVSGVSLGAGNASIMKNRIINGAMVIDQRNAGASVTNVASATTYTLDRWLYYASQASKFTIQQNAGSVTPPVGYTKYLGVTSLSAYTVGSGEIFQLGQYIEGFNTADLAWGTANAKTVTLSFQVYSSLTGTFGGALRNSASDRSYPFTFTVSSANTWTSISVTIAGDTSGTWVTDNGIGIRFTFGLGMGSSFSGTAGSWASANYISATGATSVVGTNGATFYITGVQLEVGSSATGYEYRQYGQELALCQRYYVRLGSPFNTIAGGSRLATGTCTTASACAIPIYMPASMRSAPTVAFSAINIANASNDTALTSVSGVVQLNNLITADYNTGGGMSGLGQIKATGSSSYIDYSAEL
jgi:hypothetical protein